MRVALGFNLFNCYVCIFTSAEIIPKFESQAENPGLAFSRMKDIFSTTRMERHYDYRTRRNFKFSYIFKTIRLRSKQCSF